MRIPIPNPQGTVLCRAIFSRLTAGTKGQFQPEGEVIFIPETDIFIIISLSDFIREVIATNKIKIIRGPNPMYKIFKGVSFQKLLNCFMLVSASMVGFSIVDQSGIDLKKIKKQLKGKV